MGWIAKILNSLTPATLPPVDAYDLPPIPRKKVVVVQKPSEKTGEVKAGVEWKTEWNGDGSSVSQKVATDAPATPHMVTLDQYDQAFLADIIGAKWAKDESKAKVMKWHWLREESAAAIERYHTTQDGRTERGYSERTAADFIKAYFAADDRRQTDGKKRQRPSPTAKPENVIEW